MKSDQGGTANDGRSPETEFGVPLARDLYFDTAQISNTYNNLSPRLGLPKYLEIRGSGIFNGTEDGTELKFAAQ